MSELTSQKISDKRSHQKGAFIFIYKLIRFVIVSLLAGIPLFWVLVFYLHFHPYGHAKFDQAEWLKEKDEMLQDGDRCEMAGTITEDILKPGMTRTDVEAVLGVNKQPYFTRLDGTEEYAYYLGWCSPMAWDPNSLIVRYDLNDVVLESYNMQH